MDEVDSGILKTTRPEAPFRSSLLDTLRTRWVVASTVKLLKVAYIPDPYGRNVR